MQISFKINRFYLLIHSLSARQPNPFPQWGVFKSYLRNKYPIAYQLLTGGSHPETVILREPNHLRFAKAAEKEIKNLINVALKSREMKLLEKDTQNYLIHLQREWGCKSREVLQYLKLITNLRFANQRITVYLTHPKLLNGTNIPEIKAIGWGHPEEWPNYSLVYICHELLHILTNGKFKNEILGHAIIELVCDNELRIRLKGNGVYFKENGQKIGHPSLLNLEQRILPYWREFLRNPKGKTIIDLEKKVLKSIPISQMCYYLVG